MTVPAFRILVDNMTRDLTKEQSQKLMEQIEEIKDLTKQDVLSLETVAILKLDIKNAEKSDA